MNGSEKIAPKPNRVKMSREDFIKSFGAKTVSASTESKKNDNKNEAVSVNEEQKERKEQKPRFPNSPEQYTEKHLEEHPTLRFRLNPDDFPFLSMQAETVSLSEHGEKKKTLPLDYTASKYVRATADLIAILAGETSEYSDVNLPPADMAIYLDKSARPVGWFVNVFWDAFADKPKPPKSAHLAIDRGRWLRTFGVNANLDGKIRNSEGEEVLATPNMIKEENKTVSLALKAAIRAQFIPGGIETEDPEVIMNTPTGLEGKNITIIDEVSRSGSTLEIAKLLVSQAIPEAASVNGCTFWHPGLIMNRQNDAMEIDSVPFWYDKNTSRGRGIDDPNPEYWKELYNKYPGPITRARKLGSAALGTPYDLSTDPGDASRELMREIKTLRKEWDANHIMMMPGVDYDVDKWEARLKEQGLVNTEYDGNDDLPPNDQRIIVANLKNRQPVPPHFLG